MFHIIVYLLYIVCLLLLLYYINTTEYCDVYMGVSGSGCNANTGSRCNNVGGGVNKVCLLLLVYYIVISEYYGD